MILEKQKEANILSKGESKDSIGMSLDMDSAQILMQMLSKNLYSDAIGSSIRECASNALDSHRRINCDDPIIVGFKLSENGNYEFTVEDFGTGLDANDVTNIISKYGKSTKRDSNVELGMMGLGFKAPLAYTSSFYFVARKAGIERKYIMFEGEDVNTIDLLYEKKTKERNGVKIIIPVTYSDKPEFITKMKEQLCYFENVYFDCDFIDNKFVIYRGEDFQYSDLCTDNNLHVCLDNVYYPLDFSKLGITRIDINIGLKLSLSDGVFPTPNRENLRYTKESKKVLIDKIREVSKTLVEKYNNSVVNLKNLEELWNFYENTHRNVTYDFGKLKINTISQHCSIKLKEPNYYSLKLLSTRVAYNALKEQYKNFYDIRWYYDGARIHDCNKGHRHQLSFLKLLDVSKTNYKYSDGIKGIHKDYIRWNHQNSVLILRKVKNNFKL